MGLCICHLSNWYSARCIHSNYSADTFCIHKYNLGYITLTTKYCRCHVTHAIAERILLGLVKEKMRQSELNQWESVNPNQQTEHDSKICNCGQDGFGLAKGESSILLPKGKLTGIYLQTKWGLWNLQSKIERRERKEIRMRPWDGSLPPPWNIYRVILVTSCYFSSGSGSLLSSTTMLHYFPSFMYTSHVDPFIVT